MKRLKIGLRLYGVGTLDPKYPFNVQGDEMVALGWKKYLERDDRVQHVRVYGPTGEIDTEDVLIHFHPWLEATSKCPNIWFCQNAFPDHGGVVTVFNQSRDKFKGFIYTSEALARACKLPGAVVPFAADPEIWKIDYKEEYGHRVSFVGNGIRSASVHDRFLVPAIKYGLVIYGNMWSDKYPLSACWRGKLPMDALCAVYTGSSINLNVHIDDHVVYQTINQRIYDILACSGFVLSDYHEGVRREFGDLVPTTNGGADMGLDLESLLEGVASSSRYWKAIEGRDLVLAKHTYSNRVPVIINHLQEIL